MDVWFKTGTNHRRSWIIASNGIQFSKQIPSKAESRDGRNEQFLPLMLLNLWNTLNLLSLAVMLQKSGKHSLGMEYVRPPMLHLVQLAISDILRKDQNFTSKILFALKSCSMAHLPRNSQTCLQIIEVTRVTK